MAGLPVRPTIDMKEFYRRHLPHWHPQEAVFFVTFRLKDSLPSEVIEALREEREGAKIALHNLPESKQAEQDKLDSARYFEKWEEYLDKAEFGPRWLSQPEIADIVKEALHYREGKTFDLHAYSIMSNHVHVIFEPLSKADWQHRTGVRCQCPPYIRRNGIPTYYRCTKLCNPLSVTRRGRQIFFLADRALSGKMKVMTA